MLKAFAAGCSALTGVEAIANGVPAFRTPAVKRAQRTEVALVLAFAANTSFGGLPVLMGLLAKDNRLPHLFGLRAERPVYRYGVSALAFFAAVLLIAVDADTNRLLPLFAIGVFVGFTISQAGLVRHWRVERPAGWVGRAVLNGFGALLTAIAAIVFFLSKFTEGAWLLLVIIPALVWLFGSIEHYYDRAGIALCIGDLPPRPRAHESSVVIVPVVSVTRLAEVALRAAAQLGGRIIPVAVDLEPVATAAFCEQWRRWDPGYELTFCPAPAEIWWRRSRSSCNPRSLPAIRSRC